MKKPKNILTVKKVIGPRKRAKLAAVKTSKPVKPPEEAPKK